MAERLNFGIQRHIYHERGLPIGNALDGPIHNIFDKKTNKEEWLRFHSSKWTKRSWHGAWCFLVLSIGTPRRYFLWLAIDDVMIDTRLGDNLVSGPGWTLNPPLLLEGQLLEEFEKEPVARGGLQELSSDLGEKLREHAKDHCRPGVFDSKTIGFLRELAPLAWDDSDFDTLASRLVTETARTLANPGEITEAVKELDELLDVLKDYGWSGEFLRPYRRARKQLTTKLAPPVETGNVVQPKDSRRRQSTQADNPIVPAATTPEFWENYDLVFGGKTKAAAPEPPTMTKKKAIGQGWKLPKEDQKAVEIQAMKKAAEFWKKAGYRVTDVSRNRSYDLEVTRSDEVLFVEVKGTVGIGAGILFTDREMQFAEEHVDQMRLFVLSSIQLTGEKGGRKGRGGQVVGDPMAVWDITKMNRTCSERVIRTWTVELLEPKGQRY